MKRGEKRAAPEGNWVLGGGIEITVPSLFMELESINFMLEKLSRTQMLKKAKNKQKNNWIAMKR